MSPVDPTTVASGRAANLAQRAKRSTANPRGTKRIRSGRVIGDDPQTRFRWLCKASGLPMPTVEHRFAPPRRWRWDYCWEPEKVALEVDGGLFVGGAHVRGARILKTHEKLNTAAALGWRVLYCTPQSLHSEETLTLVRQALTRTDRSTAA